MIVMQIEKIVKINEDEQNALLRTFSRLPINGKLEVMSNHRKLLHKLKQMYHEVDISTLSYCALLIALQVHKTNQDKLNRLNISDLSLNEIHKMTSQKAKLFLHKHFRRQTKRERLLSYWAVVKTLKINEKYSFRSIEKYLKKYHQLEVSYSMIAKVWNELENKKDK